MSPLTPFKDCGQGGAHTKMSFPRVRHGANPVQGRGFHGSKRSLVGKVEWRGRGEDIDR
jgi:hypothetical protein